MNLKTIVASGAVLAVLGSLGSVAWADQSFTGTVTVLDRLNNELAIKQAPAGQTTGANGAGEVHKFKMKGAIPESLHAEDKITVSYTEANGVKTITEVTEPKN